MPMTIGKQSVFPAFVLALIWVFQPGLCSQEKTDGSQTEPKLRFPVGRDRSAGGSFPLTDEIATMISEAAGQLFLDDIAICIQVDPAADGFDSAPADARLFNPDEAAGYVEALVLTSARLNQTEVSKTIRDGHFSKTGDPHTKCILTKLSLSAYFLDLETGVRSDPFGLKVTESTRSRRESRSKAFDILEDRLITELKKIYWLSAEADAIGNDRLAIPFGTEHGVKKGFTFELVSPEEVLAAYGEEWINQPRTVGLMSVIEASEARSNLKLVRQWDIPLEGSWVVERFRPSQALELFYVPPITNRYFSLGINYHARPFHRLDFGIGGQFIRLTDSFDEDDYGVGFSGFGIWRCFETPTLNLAGKLAVNLDLPFKKDDIGSTVFTSVFSFAFGILAEMAVDKRFDLVVQAGYRLAISSDKWMYSEGDDTYPAVWDGEAPIVDHSGFVFSVGFHYLLF